MTPGAPSRVLLVEGGWQRGALAAVRSLGRAGHTVGVASAARGHAARSRHCSTWHPLPEVTSPGLVGTVSRVAADGGYDVVFAGDDEHLLALSERRDELGSARFPYVPHEVLLQALDKVSLYATAERVGLEVPETTTTPPSPDDGAGWIGKERLYRPGSSHAPLSGTALQDAGARDLVYQRVVCGRLLAVVALVGHDGTVLYAGAQEAEALFPEPFGVSARARTVDLDPALEQQVGRLLRDLGWFGLAEVQFLARPGQPPALIDLNGRFFGSLALTAAAGVDLPSAWVALALGQPPELAPRRSGVGYQWLEGDLRRAWAGPGRAAQTWHALRAAPGRAHSVWTADDPAPAVRYGASLARRAIRKAVRR